MIQAKIFDSLVNNNRKLAQNIFSNERYKIARALKKSRLKNLFLELVDLNDNDKKEYLKLKKNILLRNQIIISDVINLSNNFQAFDIHYVFIKGAATLFQIDQSKALRFTSDIDVLIDLKDIKKLHKMLNEIGIHHSFDIFHDYENSKKNHTLESVRLNSGMYLDIHFRSSSPQDFSSCPYTENFLVNHDTIIKRNVQINILKLEQIYIFSLYQLFIKKEINNCSSAIVDLILIKNLHSNISSKNNLWQDDMIKIKESFSTWINLSKFDSCNFNQFEKEFVASIFKNPQTKFFRRIIVILLNIVFLKRTIKELYGINVTTKKIYIQFFIDKLIYKTKKIYKKFIK